MKFHTKMLHHIILHNIVANSLLMNEILFPNIPAMVFFFFNFFSASTDPQRFFHIAFFPSQDLTKDLILCLFVTSQSSYKLGHWSVYPFYLSTCEAPGSALINYPCHLRTWTSLWLQCVGSEWGAPSEDGVRNLHEAFIVFLHFQF